ncbi:hypothetical protein AZE42_06977 [Rhizopogon vesiculosus]|uniref:Uncharacterized protein n=1 Tax=Rhizopogon vesiculosus TaxID=180088 RepID=A0A1J8QYG2_9AGAM|nr:hypothetical protein AZE42_06977 [Rhizopogon vesiculosus]
MTEDSVVVQCSEDMRRALTTFKHSGVANRRI